eukprot:m.88735 g.88735  ORF g.88735 m.88735 type:complete len:205 (-) comp51025_c0_seq5:175-789(-)
MPHACLMLLGLRGKVLLLTTFAPNVKLEESENLLQELTKGVVGILDLVAMYLVVTSRSFSLEKSTKALVIGVAFASTALLGDIPAILGSSSATEFSPKWIYSGLDANLLLVMECVAAAATILFANKRAIESSSASQLLSPLFNFPVDDLVLGALVFKAFREVIFRVLQDSLGLSLPVLYVVKFALIGAAAWAVTKRFAHHVKSQ